MSELADWAYVLSDCTTGTYGNVSKNFSSLLGEVGHIH